MSPPFRVIRQRRSPWFRRWKWEVDFDERRIVGFMPTKLQAMRRARETFDRLDGG